MKRFMLHVVLHACMMASLSAALERTSSAQDGANGSQGQPATGEEPDLSIEQARVADRFERLEQIAARLAELSASTEPHRAELLRQALAGAREAELDLRFEAVVRLLEQERFSAATQNQQVLDQELAKLLDLLLKENRADEIRSEQEWIRAQLKEVNRILRLQRGVKARTEGGDDTDRLAGDQEKISSRTGELAEKIDEFEGKTAEGDAAGDPSDRSDSPQGDADKPRESPDSPSGDAGEPAEAEDGQEGGENSSERSENGADGPQDGNAGEERPPSEPSGSENQDGQPTDQSPEPGDASQGQPSEGQGQPGQPSPSQQGGQPGGGESDSSPAPDAPQEDVQQRLRAAQKNMQEAQQKLEEARREGAAEQQEEAIRELEQAKADLERILRQLREEEQERTLALLEARFRRMLELQLEVYEGTLRLDQVPEKSRDHDEEIEAGRLSRQEAAIVREADRAIEILLAEGTSVAFPEATQQIREDMQDVADRLAKVQVGEITQMIEEDIIAQLEEAIEALQKAMEELEKNKTPPGQSPPPGEPQEPPLVDMLEEVKMIRALQMRVNRRTSRYAEMVGGDQADQPQVLAALRGLADRQQRIYRATRDLFLEKNR